MMRHLITVLVALACNLTPAQDKPAVVNPTSAYQATWFVLEGVGEPCRVFVAWRDGRPVQFWSTSIKLPGVGKAQGNNKLLTDSLAGDAGMVTVELRLVSVWAPIRRLALQTLALEIAAGTWSLNRTGRRSTARSRRAPDRPPANR
jgi:hypothetical protein